MASITANIVYIKYSIKAKISNNNAIIIAIRARKGNKLIKGGKHSEKSFCNLAAVAKGSGIAHNTSIIQSIIFRSAIKKL